MSKSIGGPLLARRPSTISLESARWCLGRTGTIRCSIQTRMDTSRRLAGRLIWATLILGLEPTAGGRTRMALWGRLGCLIHGALDGGREAGPGSRLRILSG